MTKTPGHSLRDQQVAQSLIGKARARVEALRNAVSRAAEFAYQDVEQSGALLSREAKIRLQLGVSFAAEACAEAVRFANDIVGISSIRIGQPFERHFRDTYTSLQHSDKSSPRYASAGCLMFGLENDWVWLAFRARPQSKAPPPGSPAPMAEWSCSFALAQLMLRRLRNEEEAPRVVLNRR
jgi:hypothetical protein